MNLDFQKAYERHQAHEKLYQQHGLDNALERQTIIQKALPLGKRLLEIGTGQGYFAMTLAKEGYSLTGVDVSEEELSLAKWNIAKQGFQQQIHLQKINDHVLPFASQSFDAVFLIKVLHHLKDPYLLIDEMSRVLSPKGKIIISDFSKQGFLLVDQVHQSEGNHHTHTGKSLGDVSEYLTQKGFQVTYSKTKFQETLVCVHETNIKS